VDSRLLLLRGLKATLPSGMPMANATAIAVRAASPEEIRHGLCRTQSPAVGKPYQERCLTATLSRVFFTKHVDEGKTALPASTLRQAQGCTALSFLPTVRLSAHGEAMKILRVDGCKNTFQHNPISSIVVVQFTNTFVFWSFSSCAVFLCLTTIWV
jgi:hypothetical protein